MGTCCEPAPMQNNVSLTDLPAPLTIGKDEIEAFELSLPFARTAIQVMFAKIEEAEKASGLDGCLTLTALRQQLPTQAWSPLDDPNSSLCKIL